MRPPTALQGPTPRGPPPVEAPDQGDPIPAARDLVSSIWMSGRLVLGPCGSRIAKVRNNDCRIVIFSSYATLNRHHERHARHAPPVEHHLCHPRPHSCSLRARCPVRSRFPTQRVGARNAHSPNTSGPSSHGRGPGSCPRAYHPFPWPSASPPGCSTSCCTATPHSPTCCPRRRRRWPHSVPRPGEVLVYRHSWQGGRRVQWLASLSCDCLHFLTD